MNPIAQLHLLAAAFLAGVGSTTLVFSLIIASMHNGGRSCFIRVLIFVCFGGALLLALEGLRLGA